LLNACIAIAASRRGYHAEDGCRCGCKHILTFKRQWRKYGELVVWCYRIRKFLVSNQPS